jgi:beta-xylosidase
MQSSGKGDGPAGPWTPDQGDGTYAHPVIHADYSDPDVIRVGKDFFLTASSFNSIPGLPILHSEDLVNWRIANHVVHSLPFPDYDLPAHGRGNWAPSLRHHDGLFYVFFAMPDEGVFMSRTDDPFGRWSPIACVRKTVGWIDPCPFRDEDGSAYLVNAFSKSRVGSKSVLRVTRMERDGTGLLDEGRFVFDGQKDHPTIEGPKMYTRNGFYYLFAPAGGVKGGWQTVLRSRDVFGPYEARIVLHQGNTPINGPHKGGWVELESGDSRFLHFQDAGACGRVVHLQPVEWNSDCRSSARTQTETESGSPWRGIGSPTWALPLRSASPRPRTIFAPTPWAFNGSGRRIQRTGGIRVTREGAACGCIPSRFRPWKGRISPMRPMC